MHGLVALGVRHDNGDALALDGVHRALPIGREACGGKLEQKKIGALDAKLRGGFDAQLGKLLPVHLKAEVGADAHFRGVRLERAVLLLDKRQIEA